jgi:hypothetical protein
MQLRKFAFPVYLIFRTFSRSGAINWPILGGILSVATLQMALVILGSYIDGTWRMPGGAKGLLDHYGAWATIVTDPLIMISTAYAYWQFSVAMCALPTSRAPENVRATRRIVQPYRDFLHLKRNGVFVYALLVIVGLLAWTNNIVQTHNPDRYFGHDVFDSTAHIFGFVAHKFTLFVSWVIVYPATGFAIVAMCFSTRLVLEKLKRRNLIEPVVIHPDGCYGLAELGKLNICLLFPYLLAFAVIFFVILTHEHTYRSADIPLFFLTILFVTASYVTIKPLLHQARLIRRALYRRLVRDSMKFRTGDAASMTLFGIERTSFVLATGSPYTRNGKIILYAMRLAPVGMSALKVYHDHFG